MSEKITVYLPDNSIRKGYRALFKEMIDELRSSKWLTWQFFKRDFVTLYKQSIFGVLWALAIPVISVGTFVFLNIAGVFNIGYVKVPYPIYAIAGMALWQIFATGIVIGTNALVNIGPMITKINFPKETLIISAVGQSLVSSLIQFAFLIVLFIFYGIIPPLTILLVPIAALPIIVLTIGLSFILSILNSVIRDIKNVVSYGVTFLMLFIPILYASPVNGIAEVLNRYNPLYYLITVPRDLLIIGSTTNLHGYFYSTLCSLMIFFVCWVAFHLTETRIAERV